MKNVGVIVETKELKEYYEIINGSQPSIRISPHRCRFFLKNRNAFLLKKLSNLPSFRVIGALIASQSMFENKMINSSFYFLTFLLLFVIKSIVF